MLHDVALAKIAYQIVMCLNAYDDFYNPKQTITKHKINVILNCMSEAKFMFSFSQEDSKQTAFYF